MGPGFRRDSEGMVRNPGFIRDRREIHLDIRVHVAPDYSSSAGRRGADGRRRSCAGARRRRVGQCNGRFLSAAARRDCAGVREPPPRQRDLCCSRGHRSAGARMVGSRPDRNHGRVDPVLGRNRRRRLCRCRPCDDAQFRRAHRDRSGIARRRRRVRPRARAGAAPDHRHLRRRHGQFRTASGCGARPDCRGGDFDQRARDPHRGALARGVLPQQRYRRPRRFCPRRSGFPQLRRRDAPQTRAGGSPCRVCPTLRCSRSGSARSR